MARPNKIGLEYFSLDVKMDDEVELIKAQHGMKGFGILITMFQTIYANEGYYYKWDKRNQLLFSNKVSDDRKTVVSIINDCINWDIFNKEMYEKHNILTSKRIQKQYINATYKRKEVKLIEEFLLLEKGDIDRENIVCITVSDVRNNDAKKVSDSKNKQSNKDKDKYKESNKRPSNKSDTKDGFSIKKLNNGRYNYPEEYERIYSIYPASRGNKKAGWRKWAATRRRGVKQEDLVQAVKKYAAECERQGTSEKWIMHIKTFFGPDEHWKGYLGGANDEFSRGSSKKERKNKQRKSSKYDKDVIYGWKNRRVV